MTFANSFKVRSTACAALFLLACATTQAQVGPGTTGAIAKFNSPTSVGDSVIVEDKHGKVGVGTSQPTSKFTVAGIIESQSGGIKFPDGTVQNTAMKDPALSAFQKQISLDFVVNGNAAGANLDVPSGKRLVIEFLTLEALTQGGPDSFFYNCYLKTYVNGEQVNHWFTPIARIDTFNEVYAYQRQVKIYADSSPGSSSEVDLFANRTFTMQAVSIKLSISGYLVDLPESANRQETGQITRTQVGNSGPFQTKGVKHPPAGL
jgi:hypothetical protein